MAAETGAGVALSIKTGALLGVVMILASILGTIIGLKVIPPAKGREMDDISTRLLCGLLSSSTLGTYAAYRFIKADPEWLAFWMRIYQGMPEQYFMALASAGLPIILLSALPGFWLVAAFMRFAQRNAARLSNTEVNP